MIFKLFRFLRAQRPNLFQNAEYSVNYNTKLAFLGRSFPHLGAHFGGLLVQAGSQIMTSCRVFGFLTKTVKKSQRLYDFLNDLSMFSDGTRAFRSGNESEML